MRRYLKLSETLQVLADLAPLGEGGEGLRLSERGVDYRSGKGSDIGMRKV